METVYSGTGYTFIFLFNVDHIIKMFYIKRYDVNEGSDWSYVSVSRTLNLTKEADVVSYEFHSNYEQ
jgi:hypothetical protein